ncbi:MAG: SAM-dependent chlorinase/fluorinase [Rhodospirillales bacterium]|nr:SAM-dependent chlorinase/fluorinase [Rhodospirillales bacterium]
MIVMFTDFGVTGLYTGQVKAALHRDAPGVPVVDLIDDAPACRVQAAAYLLAALAGAFPPGAVFLAVIDPGVGSARRPVLLRANGQWFVGPDNGLFELVARRAAAPRWWEITWSPPRLSATFHGRDLFAPVAASLARGAGVPGREREDAAGGCPDWPDDLAEIIYIDGFGNAITGIRAAAVPPEAGLSAGGMRIGRARTFSDVPAGSLLCYENANGLLEIAANQGRAADRLELSVGAPVVVGL